MLKTARLAAACLLAAVWLVAGTAAQMRTVKSDQETLVELERGWNAAFYHKDVAFIGNLLADEFIATYEDGTRGDRAKELSLAADFNQAIESAIQDDFTIKVYGDTAVVWFALHLVGSSQGRSLEMTLRYVDVWVWRDGRWQCVASQSTKVTAK